MHEHEWVSITDPDTQELLGWTCRFQTCNATRNHQSVDVVPERNCSHEWEILKLESGRTISRRCMKGCGLSYDYKDGHPHVVYTPTKPRGTETVYTRDGSVPSDYLKSERASKHAAASVVLSDRKDRREAEFNRNRKAMLATVPVTLMGPSGLVGVSLAFDWGMIGWATLIVGIALSIFDLVVGSTVLFRLYDENSRNRFEDAQTAYSAHMMIDPITYKGSANP